MDFILHNRPLVRNTHSRCLGMAGCYLYKPWCPIKITIRPLLCLLDIARYQYHLDFIMSEQTVARVQEEESSKAPAKYPASLHLEEVDVKPNLVYDIVDEEPDIHMRTWIALAAMLLLNLAQVFAVQGPPAVVSWCSIKQDLINLISLTSSVRVSTTLRHKHGFRTHWRLFKQSFVLYLHRYPMFFRRGR